jgi:hypothetical protein
MSALVPLIETYVEGPKLLREAVRGMTRDQILARPVAGKMSTLEVVCHIADFEPIMAERIKLALTHDRPTLVGADENLFLPALGYHERDLEEELTIVSATRSQMARILRTLPPEAFQRVGVHTHRGELTVEKILTMACNHIPHHIPFIVEKKKALGLAG